MYGSYDFGCVDTADFAGLGDTASDCAEALTAARANRPSWTPDDSFFNPTCYDPFLSAAQAKACVCAGKKGLPDMITKATSWVSSQLHPGSGGGSTTPKKDSPTPPAGDSSDDSSSLLPAILAAGIAGYFLFK